MNSDELTTTVWELDQDEFPADEPIEEQARFLLRYAILAPSSHNSQPWQFTIDEDRIQIFADETRWLEVADHDKRELHLSLGCAIENFCIAAEHFGFDYRIQYHDSGETDSIAVVTLHSDGNQSSDRPRGLFKQITERYTSHALFEDRSLPQPTRDTLHQSILEDVVSLYLIDEPGLKRSIGELQAEADQIQMNNSEYRKELGYWVGIGALGQSWLMARIAQSVVTHFDLGDRESQKNSELVRSAPIIGLLVTSTDDPPARVKAGQAYERLALAASADDLVTHPMSQILEIPEKRERLGTQVGITDGISQHLFRLGYTDESQDHTPRWPLERFLSTQL
ncbi:Acg family FMN-binding oxidoreductase [Natronosalvus rutilus]|uniref:Nitroreductase n=1 Tax=Natronosalvus rutilus TaxID=2953753 RepID=A0A9E7N8G2_9EURY|nr:nitroreductase family protein [Natronosalvus rutilus]UTF52263.1 nitroreductase [Natronosalvus rutilus]